MKSLVTYTALLLVLCLGASFGEEVKEIVPTKNKFAKQLSESIRDALAFSVQKQTIQIQAKPKGMLPLEFVPGKGLEASDGSLSVGDRFMWPGCGFDRTRYTIKEITPNLVVIEYIRGIPQQDGYEDTGEIRIKYDNTKKQNRVGGRF